MSNFIEVEVAYALAHQQKIVKLEVAEGTTVRAVALQSGLNEDFPELDLAEAKLGVFGKAVLKPEEETVQAGDRVEIYRPLIIDPKQARLNRAAKKDAD